MTQERQGKNGKEGSQMPRSLMRPSLPGDSGIPQAPEETEASLADEAQRPVPLPVSLLFNGPKPCPPPFPPSPWVQRERLVGMCVELACFSRLSGLEKPAPHRS